MSDSKGAALLLPALPKAKELLADRGYDADWFRQALIQKGIAPCIPPKKNRKIPIAFDQILYKQRPTKWKIDSGVSRTGAASPCAITAEPIPPSPPSLSLPSSSSTSINES
jgi:transposase